LNRLVRAKGILTMTKPEKKWEQMAIMTMLGSM